jgi:hypothetical protein
MPNTWFIPANGWPGQSAHNRNNYNNRSSLLKLDLFIDIQREKIHSKGLTFIKFQNKKHGK